MDGYEDQDGYEQTAYEAARNALYRISLNQSISPEEMRQDLMALAAEIDILLSRLEET